MQICDFKKKRTTEFVKVFSLVLIFFFAFYLAFIPVVIAAPSGPDSVAISANETKAAVSPYTLNISGGRIATINISANSQNPRWKGFVGLVTGSFTLDDSTGSTLFDWSLTTVAGEIYATRNSSTPTWSAIKCANTTLMETENTLMSHTSADDNISKTFNGTTHAEFFVGAVNISVNSCPTLNTYVNNNSQDTSFEEVVLTDGTNFTIGGTVVYATILEQDVNGFDNATYDFQMIVPEVGSQGFTGSTAYYLYVELS